MATFGQRSRLRWPLAGLTGDQVRLVFAVSLLLAVTSRASSQVEPTKIDFKAAIAGSSAPHSKSFLPGRSPHRFLAVGRITEQLSKARMHLGDMAALAVATNRTMILPFCGSSRIGTSDDYVLPLWHYFDVGRLGEYVPWVTEEYYREHAQCDADDVNKPLRSAPSFPCMDTASVASLLLIRQGQFKSCSVMPASSRMESNRSRLLRATPDISNSDASTPNTPFSPSPSHSPTSFLSLSLSSPAFCYPECNPQNAEEAAVRCADFRTTAVTGEMAGMSGADMATAWQSLVAELDREGGVGGRENRPSLTSADVIIVFRQSAHPCVPASPTTSSAQHAISYAPHLHAAALSFIRTHFSPPHSDPSAAATTGQGMLYIAAHWRLEKSLLHRVGPAALLKCARGLVDSVRRWQQQLARCGGAGIDRKVPGFFLASDVGRKGDLRSSSFKSLSGAKRRAAQKAVQFIYQKLSPPSLNLDDVFINPSPDLKDRGIQGIVEKLIIEYATVVLVPPRACTLSKTPITSSFTREICRSRAQAYCAKNRGAGETGDRSHSADFVMSADEVLKGVKACEVHATCVQWEMS